MAFLRKLNAAITNGEPPKLDAPLGRLTLSAVEEIARAHPEAAPGLIADAHDAFFSEHIRSSWVPEAPNRMCEQ